MIARGRHRAAVERALEDVECDPGVEHSRKRCRAGAERLCCSALISREVIAQLAPTELDNLRSSRYRADDQAIVLAALEEGDRERVVGMYDFLRELNAIVVAEENLDDPAALLEFVERRQVGEVVHRIQRIGATTTDEHVAEVLHDIRGGALSVLFVQLSRLGRIPYRSDLARSLGIITRDHMKMMRNVTMDLDPAARERDLAFREHSLGDLAGAFREFTARFGEERVVVEVDCPVDAIIAESCVECGAIDRVAYNLLNNAARHAERPTITAWLTRFEKDLRVAIANVVSPAQRAALAERLTADPTSLFGTFTTTDSGYGLRIVAELVGHAYGIGSITPLTAGGYVGAKLIDDSFVAWFHWPLSDV